MKIKTSELSGKALDYAVAKCENVIFSSLPSSKHYYSPNSNWLQGGPIIERERIDIKLIDDTAPEIWGAQLSGPFSALRRDRQSLNYRIGNTPLIAAMRCYVASKLGDSVDIPDELL